MFPACLSPEQTLACPRSRSQVRAPTHVVSTICDDRGEEPTYYGVTMSELITEDYGIGDVLGLLWFKRKLPKCADGAECGPGVGGI